MTTTRDLWGLAEGDPLASSIDSNRLATSLGSSSYQKFGLALMEMLKKYQGLGTAKFQNAAYQGQIEQANRVMAPSEPGMPPQMQSQVRSASAGAMQPTISGAQQMGKTFSEQISGLGDAISQAGAIGQWMSQTEQDELSRQDSRRKEELGLLTNSDTSEGYKTYLNSLDPKTKKAKLDFLGINESFLSSFQPKGKEPETKVIGDKLLEKNAQTGKWEVAWQEGGTPTETPTGGYKFESLEDIQNLPVSDLTKSVMAGYGKAKDLTPSDRAKVMTELYQVGFNPYEYINRKLDSLAQSYKDVPSNFKGLVQGALPGGWNPDAATFDSTRTILTREIARLNDVGMLSDQDVKDYTKAMPKRSDLNDEVVEAKVKGVKEALGSSLLKSGNQEKLTKINEQIEQVKQYADLLDQGYIPVKNKMTGEFGWIKKEEFDPNIYSK